MSALQAVCCRKTGDAFLKAALLKKYKKEGEAMVELDQFKSILATYTEPLVEVRDSL